MAINLIGGCLALIGLWALLTLGVALFLRGAKGDDKDEDDYHR